MTRILVTDSRSWTDSAPDRRLALISARICRESS